MKRILLLFLAISLTFCKAQEDPKTFSESALNDTFITLEGETKTFSSILDQYKGQTVVIDVWASWCGDCIKGMPTVKELQKNNPEVVFLFLSLDKNIESWKKGIKKHKVIGEHYYMQSGWKGDFATFLNLDWIPRYMVIDKDQNITLFKATKANDKNLKENLN